MKYFLYMSFCLSFIFANEISIIKQQNVLYIQNIIKTEEKIAQAYEKYLLANYATPSLSDLNKTLYLGTNFDTKNYLGPARTLTTDLSGSEPIIKLNYAVTKMYDEDNNEKDMYKNALYKRDLYRTQTNVYDAIDPAEEDYVSIQLASKKAENILNIIANNEVIKSKETCFDIVTPRYCIENVNTIRWYEDGINWIEFDLEKFTDGNILVLNKSMFTSSKITALKVGTFVYVLNDSKYIKTLTSIFEVN